MKKISLLMSAVAFALIGSAYASSDNSIDRPPMISEQDARAASAQVPQQEQKRSNYERVGEQARQHYANPDLAPSEQDYQKAREERRAGHIPKPLNNRTEIEIKRNQHNQISEYIVTPGSTHIPYTMENVGNRPDRPMNEKDTLGTPKFIKFGF